MNVAITPDASESAGQAVCAPVDMTIYAAQEIKAELLAALTAQQELTLDLSGVEEIDLAGLQLLILLKREAGRCAKTLRLVNHSPAVVQVIDFCNLAGLFGDPVLLAQRASR